MDLELNGKRALVTGASYGLGFACAEALAKEGAAVALCSRDESRAKAAADTIARNSGKAVHGTAADLTAPNAGKRLAEWAINALGGVDILILSTGHPPTYPFSAATDAQWTRGIDLILRPAIELTRELLPRMRERKYGRLIYIGSIFGLQPEKSSVIQSTLRTGLNAFAKCVATEAAADGVTANVICPGYFDTPLVRELAKQYAETGNVPVETVLKEWEAFAPSKKFGKPSDLGAFTAFLASPRGEFVNGTALTIDGGAIGQY